MSNQCSAHHLPPLQIFLSIVFINCSGKYWAEHDGTVWSITSSYSVTVIVHVCVSCPCGSTIYVVLQMDAFIYAHYIYSSFWVLLHKYTVCVCMCAWAHFEWVTFSACALVYVCDRAQILTGTHIIIIILTADSKIHIKSITPFSCFCSFLSSPDSLVSNK